MPICRLCDGAAHASFRAPILNKHDISYERCADCGSLQTEPPYWLDEAYNAHNLALSDTGAVARSLDYQAVVWAAARILGLPKRASILDFGGGNGLLCRLLRDRGFDARVIDAYAENDFARGFEDNGSIYDIVTAFEVAEHLSNPKAELNTIFGRSRHLCIIGTSTYTDQGEDWWYLARETGQHVFFYSTTGMAKIAAAHGLTFIRIEDMHLFVRRVVTWRERILLSFAISARHRRSVRAYLGYTLTYDRAWDDSMSLRRRGEGSRPSGTILRSDVS